MASKKVRKRGPRPGSEIAMGLAGVKSRRVKGRPFGHPLLIEPYEPN
jgi:hypothetical protein